MDGTNQKPVRARDKVLVVAQGHLLQVSLPSTAAIPKGRGLVHEFSSQSRNRMLRLLARVDFERAGFICFVTLTYPDGEQPPSPESTERDRQVFFKRMKRLAPESSAIWRREWKPRLSGQFVGQWFPHYHFLFFHLPFLPHAELNRAWADVIGCSGYVRTEIEGVRDWKLALYYVSKYMAKTADDGGASGSCAHSGQEGARVSEAQGGEAACSLVYDTYLTAEQPKRIGRSWGVFNRKRLPLAAAVAERLPVGDWLDDARRLAKVQWPGYEPMGGCGFTLYVNEPDEWLRHLKALSEGENPDACVLFEHLRPSNG